MLSKDKDQIETEMETTIRDAMRDGRVPSECIEYIMIDEDHAMKVVVFHEA